MNKKLKIKKKTVSEQNKQLHDLKNLLNIATKKLQKNPQYITTIKHQQQQYKQQQ